MRGGGGTTWLAAAMALGGALGCDEERTAYNYVPAAEAERLDRALSAAGFSREDLTEDEPPLEVDVLHDQVHRIAFHRAPRLRSLDWVSHLTGLGALEVVGAPLPALDGLTAPCTLEELRLMRTTTESLAALSACPSLRRLWVVDVPLHSLQTLPALPLLEELYVDQVPLRDTAGLADRPALRTLMLRHGELASAAGIDRLPALETLDLSHNRLTTTTGLGPELPRLAELDLSHNQLTDAGALDRLPALRNPDLTHNRLESFPQVSMREAHPTVTDNPGAERVFDQRMAARNEAARAAREAERPREHAAELPSAHLSTRGTRRSVRWVGDDVTGEGSVDRLEGAGWIRLAEYDVLDHHAAGRDANAVRLRLRVRSGTLRVYFDRGSAGWPYVEVRPGAEGTARGSLRSGDRFAGFFVEAVGGPVEGFGYHVEPAP